MTNGKFVFSFAILAAAACSATPNAPSSAQSINSGNALDPTKTRVPRNSPYDPNLKNVPATTGRANLPLTSPPFAVSTIGKFDEPFAMAFTPRGDLLVTEKAGKLMVRTADGAMGEVTGVPKVAAGGQGGLLDVAVAPDFTRSRTIYLSYAEPGAAGSALALAKGTLDIDDECVASPCPLHGAKLSNAAVIWRSGMNGPGGQFGANILFSPDGKYLFLSSGERQRFSPAQDPKQALGKILRLTLDGKAAPGNPMYDKGGVEAMTWSTGHRNPYGMAFAPDGRLWEEEMGPRGGDELNLIVAGRNYGWPIVSNGDNYSGQPIPDHPSRPDFEAPKLWWNPSISPGGMIYYSGDMFLALKGSLLIAALSGEALIQVRVAGDTATPVAQWRMGGRIRDVAQAADGSIWLLEDEGKLVRLSK
ncbi:PQQ-dependent sugar dehydrogenase [Sphingomonas sp.]|jgi:glucose/arabinose dehydrogenase|uniref:PQQ-dependent sugar dehydrogenase n=1 Tax=Sphingomonas sp. TaxID=28214 RepID=UPI002E324923|nr:PQQ-dependent sugar dehydrogenase [Sphingomonas sp.]HEX4695751.1 PQQ-dependent sugar dehydrogenase [Sphingomonas sp.]